MLAHARPPRHERRALPGGGVLRRGGGGAVDARAHDPVQHERRARRAGRAWWRPTTPRATGWQRHGAPGVDTAPWHSDAGAPGTRHHFDASTLAPQVALPHSPAQVCGVDALEPTRIDIAYIGACTGAKLDDLRAAARVLAGRRIAGHVQLLVAPASVRDAAEAEAEGVMRQLLDAGATLLPSACGACAGYGSAHPRRQHRDLVDRAQLQGPHGRGHGAGVPGLALHRGRVGAARAASATRGSSWHDGVNLGRAWRLPAEVDTDQLAPGATMKHGLEVTARHCLEARAPGVRARGAARRRDRGRRRLRHRLVARAGGQRAGAPGRGRR